ncbi:MAG TPA: 8-amino-7-oxononanoate synthase, partial [Bacteroidia bacterium]|nr:8-amino-7-oxononanoate synthase [Bacteroidia bacterium]
NFSRPFIYTTALPLHSVKAIDSAYDLLIEGEEQGKLKENILYFNEKAKHLAIVEKSVSAIQCLHAGSNSKAEAYERSLAEHGIYSKAIKSPTVREGTERLRLCIHAFNTKSEIDQLIKALNSLQA